MSFTWSTPVTEQQIQKQVSEQLNAAALQDIRESISSETADRMLADFFIKADISALSDTVATEIAARLDSDTFLLEKIELEEIARSNAALSLADDIRTETAARVGAETELRDVFNTAIDNEKALRTQADAALTNNFTNALGSETTARQAAIANLRAQIQSETALLGSDTGSISAALTAEANTRATNDDNLSAAIETERQARIAADTSYFNSATTLISSETNLRAAADNALDTAITAEIQARISEDSKLTAAINTEKTNRTNADNALTSSFNAAITAEKTARETADAELQSSLARTLTTYAPVDSPTFTGVVKVPAITAGSTGEAAANKSYVDSAVANVTVSVFTSPTTTTDGTSGTVPAPKKTANLEVLTNLGWRALDDTSLTIGSVPSQAAALTYNRAAQSPTWLNFDASKMVITGETSGTDARTYTAKVKPIDLYLWADTKTQEERTITWKIDALKLAKPTASVTDFTYNRSQQGITVSNFDSTYMTQSGSTTATAAASYSAVYALKSKTNTTWSDGSTDNVTIPWKINVLKIAKPVAATSEFVYNGDSKTLSVTNFNNIYMSETGTKSAVSVGNYSIVYALLDAANVHWADNSVANVVIAWKIIKRELSAELSTGFAQSGEQTYTGSEITVAVTNFNPEYHVLGGDFKKTNAGTYTATVAPAGSYTWSDGTTTPKNVSWTIGKAKIDKPTASTTTFNYTGATITFVPTHAPDSNSVFVISSDSTKSAALIDNYAVKYNLRDTANYTWADGTSGTVTLNWSIVANKLSADLSSGFAQVTPLTYNGANQTVTISHTSATYHTISGNVQSDAGTYTATIAPVYGYAWNDGSTAAKTVSWKIAPVEVSIPWLDGFDYEYTGSAINAANDLQDFNSNYVQLSGDLTETEPAVYTITATLKNANYVWGTSAAFPEVAVDDTAAKTVSWRILGKPIAPPAFVSEDVEFTYSGAQKSVTVTGFQSTYMESTGTLTATDAGTYSISYTLKDTVATRWANGTQGAVVLTWKINRQNLSAALSTFSVTGEYYYNESEQTVAISGYNAAYHDITNNVKTAPNTYTAKITPKNNYAFSDGTIGAKAVEWKINRAVVRLDMGNLTWENERWTWRPNFTYDENTTVNIADHVRYTVLKGYVSGVNFPHAANTTESAKDAGEYYTSIMAPVWSWHHADFTVNGSSNTSTSVNVYWTIARKKLTATQSNLYISGTYTFNGQVQYVAVANFDDKYHTRQGSNTSMYAWTIYDAGNFEFYIAPNNNHMWSDGTVDTKTLSFTVNKKKFNKPYATQSTFTYSGDVINFGSAYVSGIDSDWMNTSGTASATVPKSYTLTVALKDTNNCTWNDNSTDAVDLSWKINPYVIPAANSSGFYQLSELTYNGTGQTVTIARMDAAHSYLDGNSFATNAGTYTVYVKPNQYHTWSDGTTDARTVEWTIKPKTVTKPYCTKSPAEVEWTGSQIDWVTYAIADYDSEYTYVSGSAIKTVIGSYSFTIRLNSKTNYRWSDNTTDNIKFDWAIIRQKLSWEKSGGWGFEVTNSELGGGTYYYIPGGRKVEIAGYDPEVHLLRKSATGGANTDRHATDVGEYTWYLEPQSNYAWSDGTYAQKTVSFTIEKAEVSVSWLNADSTSANDATISITDANTMNGTTDGLGRNVRLQFLDPRGEKISTSAALTCTTETGYFTTTATVMSGVYTVTVRAGKNVQSAVTISFPGDSHYKPINDFWLIVNISRTLSSLPSWARIKEISDAGELFGYGDFGDTYNVTYGATTYRAVLVSEKDGHGIWAICKKANIDGHFAFYNNLYYHAAASATSLTWSSSDLRSKLATIYNGLSCKELITAYTINANSTDITDYVWTMSVDEFNYWGHFGNGDKAPFHNSSGTVIKVWTRECWYDGGGKGYAVNFTGNGMITEELDASTPFGLVPCFMI